MNLSLLFLLFITPSDAAKPKVQKTLPAVSDVLLSIDGKIFPVDSFPSNCKDFLKGMKCDEPSYGSVHIETKKDGDLVHAKQVFNDPDGAQVTEESWEKGGHVQKAVIDNRATQKLCVLEVKGNKVHYQVTDKKDGSVKTAEDDLDENLVVPSTVMTYIRPRFKGLLKGEVVDLRVAVLDRREAFSFTIRKVREEKTVNGEDVMVLKMAPSSMFVKALVDPMFFYIKPATGEMFAFEGRSALRHKEGEKYKEMTVRTAYEYKVNQYKTAERSQTTGTEACSDEMMKTDAMKCSIQEAKDQKNENKTSVQN